MRLNKHSEKSMLSDNILDYVFVSQGKTTIPGVDDGEECQATDVSGLKSSNLNYTHKENFSFI